MFNALAINFGRTPIGNRPITDYKIDGSKSSCRIHCNGWFLGNKIRIEFNKKTFIER